MKKILNILFAIIALTVMAPGHAEVNSKDLDCLARNIYYEAGLESEEGRAAVGLVTINRSRDVKFSNTICGVVNQKTITSTTKTFTVTSVQHDWLGRQKIVKENHVVTTNHTVCQFSWRCENVRKINYDHSRWENSVAVAQELLAGGYQELRDKYQDAEYFHEKHIYPAWARQKRPINRIGGHVFYADKKSDLTIALE